MVINFIVTPFAREYINLYKLNLINKNMKNIIEQYGDGNLVAREYLLESIKRLHNYSINSQEALVLLYKRYGKPKII